MKVNLQESLDKFSDLWKPKIVADLNDYKVQLAKAQGEWVWHTHEDTDELFLVIEGRLTMQMGTGNGAGPGGPPGGAQRVEHRPTAEDVCQVLLIEPYGTRNTGDVGGDRPRGTSLRVGPPSRSPFR